MYVGAPISFTCESDAGGTLTWYTYLNDGILPEQLAQDAVALHNFTAVVNGAGCTATKCVTLGKPYSWNSDGNKYRCEEFGYPDARATLVILGTASYQLRSHDINYKL